MKVHTDKRRREVHKARVDEAEVNRLIAERVAQQVGVSLDAPGVTWRAYRSSRDTSIGLHYDVEVEIIDDYSGKPVVADGPGRAV